MERKGSLFFRRSNMCTVKVEFQLKQNSTMLRPRYKVVVASRRKNILERKKELMAKYKNTEYLDNLDLVVFNAFLAFI